MLPAQSQASWEFTPPTVCGFEHLDSAICLLDPHPTRFAESLTFESLLQGYHVGMQQANSPLL